MLDHEDLGTTGATVRRLGDIQARRRRGLHVVVERVARRPNRTEAQEQEQLAIQELQVARQDRRELQCVRSASGAGDKVRMASKEQMPTCCPAGL